MKKAILTSIIVLVLIAAGFFLYHRYQPPTTVPEKLEFPVLRPDAASGILPLEMYGPHNEPPVGVDVLLDLLDDIDLQEFRKKNYKAAICMHYGNNDWSILQVQGINDTLKKLGVDVVLETNGELNAEKQIADYENVIAAKPDVIITIPVDSVKTAPILRKAAQQGIKLVFMDTIPEGFEHPRDYIGLVIADSYANSRVAVEILANRIGQKGQVAMIHWKSKMFTCDQRSLAARKTFAQYKDIQVVAEDAFLDFYEVGDITRRILKEHPKLDGMWVIWDFPALEAVEVIREMKKDVVITTMDLGYQGAMTIAEGDILIGTGAEHPYHQGVAEAIMAVVALAGKDVPPYVVVPGEKVTAANLPQAWQRVFRSPLPAPIQQKLQKLAKQPVSETKP